MIDVLRCADLAPHSLEGLLGPYGLAVDWVAPGAPIPGSYWGEPEAGVIGARLYVRPDTPVHSALHEAGHWLCADAARRRRFDTDAAGDTLEECAVCYLQVVLGDRLPGVGRERMWRDMDSWGYSFRLGSAREWFTSDADDAVRALSARGLP